MPKPFRCFNTSPQVIRLVVMMYIRCPLSLRQVEDLLFVRINGQTIYLYLYLYLYLWLWLWLWRAVDHEGEVLEVFASKRRERGMARFRDIKSLQKFSSVHASRHNLFNHE